MSQARAMTLIEMVAALAIASVVAAASLHVLSRLPRAQHQGQKEYALASADAKLGELFRADLSHAVRLRQHDAELQLQVRLSLDAETMRFRHVPSEVTYILRDIGGERADAWMIGDNHTDIAVAHRAGIHSIFVTYGFGTLHAEAPERTAAGFDEIPDFFLKY